MLAAFALPITIGIANNAAIAPSVARRVQQLGWAIVYIFMVSFPLLGDGLSWSAGTKLRGVADGILSIEIEPV
jgi:hypothetical protein